MKLKMLLLGSAAMLFAGGAAQAADNSSLVVSTAAPVGDVFKCGTGGIMKPGSEWCYRLYGEYGFVTEFGYEIDYGDDPYVSVVEGVGPADHPSWSGFGSDYGLSLIVTRMTPKGPIELRFPIVDGGNTSISGIGSDSFRLRIGSTSGNYWEITAGSDPHLLYRLRSNLFDFTWEVEDESDSIGPLPDFHFTMTSRDNLSETFFFEQTFDIGLRESNGGLPAFDYTQWEYGAEWGFEFDVVTLTFDAQVAQDDWNVFLGYLDLDFGAEAEFEWDDFGFTVWGAFDRIDPTDPDNLSGSSSAFGFGGEVWVGLGERATATVGANFGRNDPMYTGYAYDTWFAGNFLEVYGAFEVEWSDMVTTEWTAAYNTGPAFLVAGDANTLEIGVESTITPWSSFDDFEITAGVTHERQLGGPGLSATSAEVGFTFDF